MEDHSSLTHIVARELLQSPAGATFTNEEHRHPWLVPCVLIQQPLLRLWDHNSGSQPDSDEYMRARNPRQRLDTAESRHETLGRHINHRIWESTPYISFTTDPLAIEDLAAFRDSRNNRGPHMLTAVHPGVRRMKGLPFIDVGAEMNYYGIQDPYRKSNLYYRNHYACLWEVTPAEIVGHWTWDFLKGSPNWFDDVVMPAYDQVTKDRMYNVATREIGSLRYINNLHCMLKRTPCPDYANAFEDDDFDEVILEENSDSDGEDVPCYLEADLSSDTDDEVEEANRADDILKIIEGDW